jgi:flagellar FliJ protein
MPFHFSLQALLRLRESFERRERLRLQIVTREVVKAQQQWEVAKQERAKALEQFAVKLRQGMRGIEVQVEQACDRVRVRRIAALRDELTKLQTLRRRQLEVFRQAQQQRKILENLRSRQLAAYRLAQSRRTQQQLDERFLITHAGQSPLVVAQ